MGAKLFLTIDANENPAFMNFFYVMLKKNSSPVNSTDLAKNCLGPCNFPVLFSSGVINGRGCITAVFSLVMSVPLRLSLQRRIARITNIKTSPVHVVYMVEVVIFKGALYIARRTVEKLIFLR